MKYENVKFGSDCRDLIIAGVNLAADAVAVTYGPNGRNSIIRTNEGIKRNFYLSNISKRVD